MRWLLLLLFLPSAAAGIAAVVPDLPGHGPGDEAFALRNEGQEPWNLTGWRVESRAGTWPLPAQTLQPAEVAWFTGNATAWAAHDGPAATAWNGSFALANDDGYLALQGPGERERWAWGPGGLPARSPGLAYMGSEPTPRLHRVGESEIAPTSFEADVLAYTLPGEAYNVLRNRIEAATERVWLHVYDLRHAALTDALAERAAAGIDVRVLLDAQPVGHGDGERHERDAGLARLQDAGAHVVLAGHGRYAFHHLKVLLVDGAVAIQSENWNDHGVPMDGPGNRGWGVVLEGAALADWFAAWMADDQSAWDSAPWSGTAAWAPIVQDFGPMPPAERAVAVGRARVTPIVAPDHTAHPDRDPVLAALDNATTRIWTQQLQIEAREENRLGWDASDRYLDALIAAADRGVDVRVHASVIDPLAEARLAAAGVDVVRPDPAWMTRLHNKGWIIDDTVVVGSMNANHASRSANREVSVLVESPEAAAYFARAFLADEVEREEGRAPNPWLAAPIVAGVAAAWAGFTRR